MITEEELDRLQALADTAKVHEGMMGVILPTPAYLAYANAATEAVPELIAEVRRLREELEKATHSISLDRVPNPGRIVRWRR